MAATSLETRIAQIDPIYQQSFLAILKGQKEVSIPSRFQEWKDPFPLQLLVEIIATSLSLRRLKMSSDLTIVKDVDSLLVQLIQPSILALSLMQTRLAPSQLVPMIKALESNSTLQSLELYPFDSSLGCAIGTVLERNHSLLELKLENCLTPKSGMDLAAGLKMNTTLVHLSIARSHLEYPVGIADSVGVAIVSALVSNPSIRELNLCATGVGPATANELIKLVPRLSRLDLGYNEWIGYGMEGGLMEAIAEAPNLTFLNLEQMGLEASGFAAIGKMLLNTPKLKTLILNDKSITDSAIRGLAPGIAQNSSLEVLCLEEAYISAVGAKLLAESLATNCSLTRLHLGFRYDSYVAHSSEMLETLAAAAEAFVATMEITLKTNTTLRRIEGLRVAKLLPGDSPKSELMKSILASR